MMDFIGGFLFGAVVVLIIWAIWLERTKRMFEDMMDNVRRSMK